MNVVLAGLFKLIRRLSLLPIRACMFEGISHNNCGCLAFSSIKLIRILANANQRNWRKLRAYLAIEYIRDMCLLMWIYVIIWPFFRIVTRSTFLLSQIHDTYNRGEVCFENTQHYETANAVNSLVCQTCSNWTWGEGRGGKFCGDTSEGLKFQVSPLGYNFHYRTNTWVAGLVCLKWGNLSR